MASTSDHKLRLPSPERAEDINGVAAEHSLADETEPIPLHNVEDSTSPASAQPGLDVPDGEEDVSSRKIDRTSQDAREFPRLGSLDASDDVPKTAEQQASPQTKPKLKPVAHVPVEHSKLRKMHKFSLYETQQRYYLVGADNLDTQFRMLKIDRTSPPGQLIVVEDDVVYTKREMNQLLSAIDHGNRAAGGMKLKGNSWGLLGFIRFTDAYYMLTVTKRQQVAMVGGYFIYRVDGTELVPLTTGSSSRFQSNRNPEEVRYLSILNNLDLHHSFYFSYSYNVTRCLQHNIIHGRNLLAQGLKPIDQNDINDMFVWNHHLLSPAVANMRNPFDWCLPIIHGFIDQSSVNCFGRNIYITLIARRSRFFAGARFLKRGVNDLGYVANDVETEQIVADMMTTSFNGSDHYPLQNPNYTSFVQHRGSIPLHWTQDNSGVTPKPAIDLTIMDPFYASAALHFDNMFERYGAPVCVLNLVKARERTPRESKLLVEYQNAVNYLNQSLPEEKRIVYRAYDMARAAKTRGQDVIGTLESISAELLQITGFFHNGSTEIGETCVQNGVTRSNCIDCLDRTNAAQFVVGKTAFAAQLQALGVIAGDSINYDSDASNLFAHMFNDHGDTLANQYGGSHLVNTTDSYRKIANWQSHSRDMLESFKRFYHNSFLDSQRQEAYNLFLGNYKYTQGEPMLWELPNDYYLHHAMPSSWSPNRRRNYIDWYTPEFLETRVLPPITNRNKHDRASVNDIASDWWQDYYRPQILTFQKSFAYRINSTSRYLPKTDPTKYNMSPFCVRKAPYEVDVGDKQHNPADVTVNDVNSHEVITPLSATLPPRTPAKRISSLQQWLHPDSVSTPADSEQHYTSPLSRPGTSDGRTIKQTTAATAQATEANLSTSADANFKPADKALRNQWTLRQFHSNSLHPTVTDAEAHAYEHHLAHPLRLPLVVSNEVQAGTYMTFKHYLESADGGDVNDNNDAALETEFEQWLHLVEDPLTIKEEDGEKKRYQAYRKWLRGKSLFKQSKMDPEYSRSESAHARTAGAVALGPSAIIGGKRKAGEGKQ